MLWHVNLQLISFCHGVTGYYCRIIRLCRLPWWDFNLRINCHQGTNYLDYLRSYVSSAKSSVKILAMLLSWSDGTLKLHLCIAIYCYRLQTKFGAKSYFQKRVSVILSIGACVVGGCMAGGMHGKGCMAGGEMHSREACIVGGMYGRGACAVGVGACMAGVWVVRGLHTGETATEAGCTHPTGMHSCSKLYFSWSL